MAFLVIGARTMLVVRDSANQEPYTVMGKRRRAVDGTPLSSQRTAKRAYSVTVEFTSAADIDAFLGEISVGGDTGIAKSVSVSSEAEGMTRGATFNAHVVAGRAQPYQTGPEIAPVIRWAMPITIDED